MWCCNSLRRVACFAALGISFAMAAGPGAGTKKEKVVRFLTPWTNTSAVLYVNGDSLGVMTKVADYCGWFQANVPSGGELAVYFKQTIGNKYYGNGGVSAGRPDVGGEISLDSLAQEGDTLWVRSFKADAPELYTQYPGVLGDCPAKKLPVMMFDWYDGSRDNHKKYNPKTRDASLCGAHCTETYGGEGISADFGGDNVNLCWPNSPVSSKEYYEEDRNLTDYNSSRDQVIENMVERVLGKSGVPVRNESFDWEGKCRNAGNLNRWFMPETLAVKDGRHYTNATCRDLDLVLDDDGIWRGQMDRSTDSSTGEARGGMFLIDDFQFLDDEKTIPNPYYDSIPSGFAGIDGSGKKSQNAYHNYGMSMKVQAKFEYIPGQYFEFLGDDDVWVFIDNRLVVDIGGVHDRRRRAVDLDTLGLIPDSTYTFHIFYTERYKVEGNFKMRTSIDLKTDASMFLVSDVRGLLKNYEVWQVNKKDALSCDFSAAAQTTMDTTGGASTFRLRGGAIVEPEELSVGVWYEGIHITSDSTFTIDSAAIVENYALAPGHYFLDVLLKSDPSQIATVEITVPSYAVPSIAFADAGWKILGKEVSGDTLQIGKWAHEIYPVNITFLEDWAQVNNYNKKITLVVSDPLVDILDENGNKITKLTLDSDGRATFYVRANGAVAGAVLTAQGAAATASYWKDLVFLPPPIPRVAQSKIFDRNGDGRGDSLYILFDKPLDSRNILDSLQFKFGESFPVFGGAILGVNGTEVSLTAEGACGANEKCGFGSRRFTGGESGPYEGSLITWFTYIDEEGKSYNFQITDDPVQDGIGPVIVSAERTRKSDGSVNLVLTFSEAISDSTRSRFAEMFEFVCIRNGIERVLERPLTQGGSGNRMLLIFSASTVDAVLPTDGDQVRFAPGYGANSARDLAGIAPHAYNPWVTITGEQELSNESPGVVTLGADNPIVANPQTTQPLLVTNGALDAQQIGDSLGVQGNWVDFDIYKMIQEQTKKEISTLDAYIDNVLGSATDDTLYNVTEITEEEALAMLFEDIANGLVGEAYGIREEIVQAVQEGVITLENYRESPLVNAADLEAIRDLTQKNIDESRDSVMVIVPASNANLDDLFASIVDGRISESVLRDAGVSADIVAAIKNGSLTADNLPLYRSADATLTDVSEVKLIYSTKYYSHLGHYVGGASGSIACSDTAVYGPGGCETNKGRIFLAWNMRGNDGRLVGTGAYIARLRIKVKVGKSIVVDQTRDKFLGVRRGKTNGIGLDF